MASGQQPQAGDTWGFDGTRYSAAASSPEGAFPSPTCTTGGRHVTVTGGSTASHDIHTTYCSHVASALNQLHKWYDHNPNAIWAAEADRFICPAANVPRNDVNYAATN